MKVMRDLVGETLSDRYRLLARLAGGGMGEVYRGHDLLLDRVVAVKILQHTLAADPRLVARFKDEARAAARLAHPNVAAVHDWGAAEDDVYYMVMEYVSGTDLRDLLVAHGTLDPSHALQITISVCDALHAAHERGLVHRDIKPENVLIARDGVVKVVDFGIAAITDVDHTSPGDWVPGTLRYLSPEQASGAEATFASDLWAAGAVLFEMVTGQPPHNGSGADLLKRRAAEPPIAPSTVAADVPSDLDPLVLRACAVDPLERFLSAGEMADACTGVLRRRPQTSALQELLDETTGEIKLLDAQPTAFMGRSKGSRRRMWPRLALIAAVLAFMGTGIAWALSWMAPDPFEVPRFVGLTKAKASTVAEEMGLTLTIGDKEPSLTVEKGHIVAQLPSSGLIDPDGTVTVTISSGLPFETIEPVTGMLLAPAQVALRAQGFEVGEVTRRNDLAPAGTVIAQSPNEGRHRRGTAIALVVSDGPAPIGVPDVAGSTVAQAKKILKDAGFEFAIDDEYSNSVPAGEIIRTEPGAGSTAPQGSTVTVIVSMGAEFKKLTMPDVRGMSVADATAQLEGMGLRVRTIQSAPGSTVCETDPIAGRPVRENDLVALFIC